MKNRENKKLILRDEIIVLYGNLHGDEKNLSSDAAE